jgi:chromosome segregation ATPase
MAELAGFWDEPTDAPAGSSIPVAKAPAGADESAATVGKGQTLEDAQHELATVRRQLTSKKVAQKNHLAQIASLQQQLVNSEAAEACAAAAAAEAARAESSIQAQVKELTKENVSLESMLEAKQRRVAELEAALDVASAEVTQECTARLALEHASEGELESVVMELQQLKKRSLQKLRAKDATIVALEARLALAAGSPTPTQAPMPSPERCAHRDCAR